MSDTATATDLEARLDQVESRFAIEDLIASYAKGFDTEDPELLHSIWHDDCVLDHRIAPGRFRRRQPHGQRRRGGPTSVERRAECHRSCDHA